MINSSDKFIIRVMISKKKLLQELKKALIARFGKDIDKVILFGSRATGKARPDSDYDILIVLNRDYNWEYEAAIIDAIFPLQLEYDIFFDIKTISTHELHHTIKGTHPLYEDALLHGTPA